MRYFQFESLQGTDLLQEITSETDLSEEVLNVVINFKNLRKLVLPTSYTLIAEVFFKQIQILIGNRCEPYLNSYVTRLGIPRFNISYYRNTLIEDLPDLIKNANQRSAVKVFPINSEEEPSTNLLQFLLRDKTMFMNVYSRSISSDFFYQDFSIHIFLGQVVSSIHGCNLLNYSHFIASLHSFSKEPDDKLQELDKNYIIGGTLSEITEQAEQTLKAICKGSIDGNDISYFSKIGEWLLNSNRSNRMDVGLF